MSDHNRKKKKKKRGRSKLFGSCFRSFAVDERPILNINNDYSDSHGFKTGRLGKPDLVAADDVTSDVNSVKDDVTRSGGVDDDTERSCYGRGVSRLVKAVLFDSVMAKKINSSSKSSVASDNTNETFSSIENTRKQSDDSHACSRVSTDIEESSSRCSNPLSSSSSQTTSTSYSSSSSSSANSNSRWLSEPKTSSPQLDTTDSNNPISSISSLLLKPKINTSSQTDSISLPLAISSSLQHLSQLDSFDSKNTKSSGNNLNILWCLFLLLSLIVLVVYGRLYAILCTSIWFYLVPCRRAKRVDSVPETVMVTDTESEQYKKRVIMAGLLDRTRNPLIR